MPKCSTSHPVSLWIEDYSAVRQLFEQWRADGVDDIEAFLLADPKRVQQCTERMRILKVNRKTLSLFGARDLDHLMANLGQVMRDDTFKSLVEEMVQLWNGEGGFSANTVNYTLGGPASRHPALRHRSCPVTKRTGTAS